MLKLFPNVSITVEICISKTSIRAELTVPYYSVYKMFKHRQN